MKRLFAFAACAAAVLAAGTASAHRTITATRSGHDLAIVVSGVTDYCASDADITILRQGDIIRIVRDRPSRVSRCVGAHDVSVVVHDVAAGNYRITYEQMPLVAPAHPLMLAATNIVVNE